MRIIPALLVAATMVANVAAAVCGDQTITCPTAGATMKKPDATTCTDCDATDCCTDDSCEAATAPTCVASDFQECSSETNPGECVCMDNYADATPNDGTLTCDADACSGTSNTCDGDANEVCTNSANGETATCSCSTGFVDIGVAPAVECVAEGTCASYTDDCPTTGDTMKKDDATSCADSANCAATDCCTSDSCEAATAPTCVDSDFQECSSATNPGKCVCMDNYSDTTPDDTDDTLVCEADACSGTSNDCGDNQDCTNSADGMTAMCSCSDTFVDMNADEAVLDCETDPCPGTTTCEATAFQECVGTSGSAVCECMDGYTDTEDGDGVTCIVDEEGSCSTETAACGGDTDCAACMSNTGDDCTDDSTTCDGMKEMYCCNAGEDCSENTLYLAVVNCQIELDNCTVTALCEEDGATSGAISPFFSSSPKFTVLGALASAAATVFAGNPLF